MKECTECRITKPFEEFQKRARAKDGCANLCKLCKRSYDQKYYRDNPGRKVKLKGYDDKRVADNKAFVLEYLKDHPCVGCGETDPVVLEYLKDHPCVGCGETDPVVLEFDHNGDKLDNVSTMVIKYGMGKLVAEIAKCTVRCANCHRRKTAIDFGYWRAIAE